MRISDWSSDVCSSDLRIRIGIHIAAPGLAVTRDSDIDKIARARMSTVYAPGQKIPMLPDELIQAFSLDAGQSRSEERRVGKECVVRVDLGGRGNLKKKKTTEMTNNGI